MTGKVEISEGAKEEAKFAYLHDIVALAKEHNVPSSLILNLDQTPLKYVPIGRQGLAKKGSKSVSIAGSADKRSILGTLIITLLGNFLQIQLIYGGKTTQSLARFKFSGSFSLSRNPKHRNRSAICQ